MADFIWTPEENLPSTGGSSLPFTVIVLPRGRLWQALVPASGGGAFARACEAALGATPRTGAVVGGAGATGEGVDLVWMAINQFFLFGRGEALAGAVDTLSGAATLLDQGDGRAILRVEGRSGPIREALASLLPLDLRPAAFGPGSAAASEIDLMPVNVWCDPRSDHERIVIHISTFRSYSRSLMHALSRAGHVLNGT